MLEQSTERSIEYMKKRAYEIIDSTPMYQYKGSVSKLLGLTVEVKLPGLKIGDLCFIETHNGEKKPAEVVAFKGDTAQLLLLYDGSGIGQGCLVSTTREPIMIPVGDFLLGRLISPMGEPIDGKPMDTTNAPYLSIDGPAPGPFERPIISEMFSTGVRAIDSAMTMGAGQRMGLMAGSGVGKSTLLGMIARNSDADVNVVALIGERGREVKEFVEDALGFEFAVHIQSVFVCRFVISNIDLMCLDIRIVVNIDSGAAHQVFAFFRNIGLMTGLVETTDLHLSQTKACFIHLTGNINRTVLGGKVHTIQTGYIPGGIHAAFNRTENDLIQTFAQIDIRSTGNIERTADD